jgi:Cu/Ag efflux protein CusF
MMKKFLTTLSGLIFLTTIGISLFAGENTEKPKTKANIEKTEKKENLKKINKAYGEITKIDLETNTLTLKQEDGTEIVLKATTDKMKEEIKKYKVGDKVKVLYIKNTENILFRIIMPEEKKKREEKGQKKN